MSDTAVEDISGIMEVYSGITSELKKVIVGQDEVVEELLVAVLSGGHCLLEGVPGLGKTLLISSLAEAMDLSFKRIQFTPDLMPSDITGTEVIQDDPVKLKVQLPEELPSVSVRLYQNLGEPLMLSSGTPFVPGQPLP